MSTSTIQTRNSRWTDAPSLDQHGRPRVVVITPRDIDGIFRPLACHRYLPADYLHAFAGGSLDALVNRLNLLSRRPNLYLSRPRQQRANASANHRRVIYELAGKGMEVLQQQGIPDQRRRSPANNFAHELMTCQLMASFELGARETGARLIGWSDILNSKSLPAETRHSPNPFSIPISASIDNRQIDGRIVADGSPFGVERITDGKRYYFFCPGIEADCGTEPVDTYDMARSSICKKFAQYLAIEAQGVYRTHFGFPNFYVPFITTSKARLASMMAALAQITGSAGSKIILFKTFPAFTSFEPPRPPSGHILTEYWSRAGHPPFNFLTS